jgi:transcriptional regulator with XRE-family HTH domain
MDLFGNQIAQERIKQNMSLTDLSFKTNITEEILTNIENGKHFPDVRQLMTIALALGKKEGHFFRHIVL